MNNVKLLLIKLQIGEDEKVGKVAYIGERRNACSILVDKSEGKR
jgi:hypothetical protein